MPEDRSSWLDGLADAVESDDEDVALYQAFEVNIEPPEPPVGMADEGEILDGAMTFEARTVFLQVGAIDIIGDEAEVRRFGESVRVPLLQLHRSPMPGHNVYPTGETSPYTSLEDIKTELKEAQEDA